MSKQLLFYILGFALAAGVVLVWANPPLGSYTTQADVCPGTDVSTVNLHLINGETLIKISVNDVPSHSAVMGCKTAIKYVQYLR